MSMFEGFFFRFGRTPLFNTMNSSKIKIARIFLGTKEVKVLEPNERSADDVFNAYFIRDNLLNSNTNSSKYRLVQA